MITKQSYVCEYKAQVKPMDPDSFDQIYGWDYQMCTMYMYSDIL